MLQAYTDGEILKYGSIPDLGLIMICKLLPYHHIILRNIIVCLKFTNSSLCFICELF